VENSKQQFEEDSSCCRNITENFSVIFTIVLRFYCIILMFILTDEFIQEVAGSLSYNCCSLLVITTVAIFGNVLLQEDRRCSLARTGSV